MLAVPVPPSPAPAPPAQRARVAPTHALRLTLFSVVWNFGHLHHLKKLFIKNKTETRSMLSLKSFPHAPLAPLCPAPGLLTFAYCPGADLKKAPRGRPCSHRGSAGAGLGRGVPWGRWAGGVQSQPSALGGREQRIPRPSHPIAWGLREEEATSHWKSLETFTKKYKEMNL